MNAWFWRFGCGYTVVAVLMIGESQAEPLRIHVGGFSGINVFVGDRTSADHVDPLWTSSWRRGVFWFV
jgi:hypothetical protein